MKFNTSLITSTVGIPVVLSEAKVQSRLKIDKMRNPYIYIHIHCLQRYLDSRNRLMEYNKLQTFQHSLTISLHRYQP